MKKIQLLAILNTAAFFVGFHIEYSSVIMNRSLFLLPVFFNSMPISYIYFEIILK
jgi:TRAP-type mannitol/chloroaromatic compound transport system permease large subunit